MRFRFCGDDDCPDWILAQINTLSRMNLPELSKLVKIVADSIINNTNLAIDIEDTSTEVKLDCDDFKTAVAAVFFIFSSSVRFSVSTTHLSNELQQIGLQAKHASTLCEVYNDRCSSLFSALVKESFKRTSAGKLDAFIKDGRIIISWAVRDNVQKMDNSYSFAISKDQLEILLHDLNNVYERMNSDT